jgi:uncharacterized protein
VIGVGVTADGTATRRPPVAPNAEPDNDSSAHMVPPARDAAQKPPGPNKSSPDAAGPALQIVTIIDGKSGARQEVRIPASPEAGVVGGAASDDAALIEMTRNGPIPRIGADGSRAAQAYAKPVAAKPNTPQIAIVISGLGVSFSGTTDAINKLPSPITFAFLPYGNDLEKLTAKAQGLGHELLVEVPMEPFDYPDNDPGPQTLITSLSPEQNIDRLQWVMSRFQRYVGVANLMGARFTASELSLLPIMREIGRRGLIYVDDSSSPRSLASQIAGGNSLAFAKASLVLDSVPSASEIDRAGPARRHCAQQRRRGRIRRRPAGHDRAHRPLGQDRRKPRLRPGADYGGGRTREAELSERPGGRSPRRGPLCQMSTDLPSGAAGRGFTPD